MISYDFHTDSHPCIRIGGNRLAEAETEFAQVLCEYHFRTFEFIVRPCFAKPEAKCSCWLSGPFTIILFLFGELTGWRNIYCRMLAMFQGSLNGG